MMIILMNMINRFKQNNACKKINEELMLIGGHPTKVSHWCMTKHQKL